MNLEIPVGSVAVGRLDTNVCFAGELGVCYRTMEREGLTVQGFIFETGRFAEFLHDDVALLLSLTGRICEAVADYQFRNPVQLKADFRAGRFAAAFPSLKGKP